MAERDLIQQLDEAVEAMLQARSFEAGPEVTELARIGSQLRDLPDQDFQAKLRRDLATAIRDLEKEQKNMSTATMTGVRSGYPALLPYLHVKSAAGEIEFLKTVLGAEEILRFASPDGSKVMHAEVRIGDSVIEMGEPDQVQPMALHVYVPDVDAAYQRALDAGASSLGAPTDHEYGERGAGVRDREGNFWYLATAQGAHFVAKGLRAVNIYPHPKGAPAFIDFLKSAFGAEEIARHEAGGAVVHAEMRFGDSVLEMGEAHGPYQPMPSMIHYYVPDADEAYRRAIAAGAVSVRMPEDQPYGERNAAVKDAWGNTWFVATPKSA